MSYSSVKVSLGLASIYSDGAGICDIDMSGDIRHWPMTIPVDPDLLEKVVAVLEGTTESHSIPLSQQGTPFQLSVWEAISKIPYGKTISYTELAQEIGKPTAFRAVANACGKNKIAILVPCHRVVRSNGGYGGYRWGYDLKVKLLSRER